MTRLEQALRWWRNHDHAMIPARHFKVLDRAGMITESDDEGCVGLSTVGEDALASAPEESDK